MLLLTIVLNWTYFDNEFIFVDTVTFTSQEDTV